MLLARKVLQSGSRMILAFDVRHKQLNKARDRIVIKIHSCYEKDYKNKPDKVMRVVLMNLQKLMIHPA